jgi:membrane-associated phospholipid phosphatase
MGPTAPGVAAQQSIAAEPLPAQTAARDGRRPLHDFAATLGDLGRDFWRTLSAPAWMDSRAWVGTGAALAVGGVLFLADQDITNAALRNTEEPGFESVVDVGTFLEPVGLMGKTNAFYAGGAVLSYAAGLDRPKRMFTELLYSHWIAGLIRGGTNKLVGRSRPYVGLGSRHFKFGQGTSFPSGHASTIFQVAAVLSHHIDRVPVSAVLYGLASMVAVQRITSEQHWASDVWLGAAYGWAVARLVIRLHEEEAIGIEPAAVPGGVGMAVRWTF